MSSDFSGKHAHFEPLVPEATGLAFTTDPEKGGYKVKEPVRSRKCKLLAIALLAAGSTLYLQTRHWPLKSGSGLVELNLPGPPSKLPKLPKYTLPSHIANNLGPYAARYVVPSEIKTDLPPECEVKMVNILQRHGARYPTLDAGEALQKTLKKLQHLEEITDPSFEFVSDFKFEPKKEHLEQLVDFGRKQLYVSGKIIAQKYSTLGNDRFVRALNDKDRVKESSQWWIQGFTGKPFNPANRSLTGPDHTIKREEKDRNKHEKGTDDKKEHGREWLGKFAPAITKRLNSFLRGADLDDYDTLNLMNLCGYHTAAEEGHASPWCGVFKDEEWKSHEYYYDLEKYYEYSYGSLSTKRMDWVGDLKARLIGEPDEKNDPKTFPIGPNAPRVFADFYSDNNIMKIIASMGILHGDSSLPKGGPIPLSQQMVVSKVVPFAGCMVVEKISCSAESRMGDYVRIFINDALVPLPSCDGDNYGMCTLDGFFKSLPLLEKTSGRISE